MTIETANRLYELRKAHGLSQEELAEKLGISRQAVSKWERCEASPDTDNLISLAKLYGLSLDELIYGENNRDKQDKEETREDNITPDDEQVKGTNRIDIGPSSIFLESEDGDKMQINLHGIRSMHINEGDDDEDDDLDDDDFEDESDGVIVKNGHFHVEIEKPKNKVKFWLEVPYPMICAILYLLFGCLDICGGWALSWIIFITIPIYYSFVEAIYKRKFDEFAYPVFTAFLYLYIGLYHGIWHPSWIIFITVPVYYSIANALDKKIAARRIEKSEEQ